MFEYLNISDVDALKSLIEKLIADADEFAADIRRKDHAITELQIKVLAACYLEVHSAGMATFCGGHPDSNSCRCYRWKGTWKTPGRRRMPSQTSLPRCRRTFKTSWTLPRCHGSPPHCAIEPI